ncbi:MAG: hotdog domain-containing protein [Burkholderiaceae bacterium]|nr:hotdog domain-containing protein [Burkholderiaceae bacterium]
MKTVRPIAAYPMQTLMHPRFGDVDSNRHLNNVAQARLFEEGTSALHRKAISKRPAGRGIVAQHTLRYLSQGSYPEPLTLGTGILRIGNRSYEIEQLLLQEGRPVSTCNTVVVYLEDKRPTALPEHWREALAALAIDTTLAFGEPNE